MNLAWRAPAVGLIVLALTLMGQVSASGSKVAARSTSIKQLLRASEAAFAAASSVSISGYIRYGKTLEELDLAVLSDGDGSYSFKINKSSAQVVVVGGSAYFYANATYLKKYGHYSSTKAAMYADTWLQEGTLDSANLTAGLSFSAILTSFSHPKGKLSKTASRRLGGIPVVGLRSSQKGYLYIARSATSYPVELQVQIKGVHEVLRFSGWNSQSEPLVPASDIKVGSNQSDNWAGYVLTTTAVPTTQVGGNWTVPFANCVASPNTNSSSWIGIDGQSNGRVFQTGIETDCLNGKQADYGWFESYPNPPVTQALLVHPGDSISAELRQVTPGYWSYTLSDLTSGQVASSPNPIFYPGPGSSAEWIEEDPGNQVLPLTDFGIVEFSNLNVNGSVPSLDPADNDLNMIQKGQLEAEPSLFGNGTFSVSYR